MEKTKALVEAHRQAKSVSRKTRTTLTGSGSGGPPAPPTQNQHITRAGGAGIQPNVTWFSQDLRILHKLWGGPPGPRGSPWTRFSPTESASSAQGKPTRASAADQGVRPTINADCPILTKPSDIGLKPAPREFGRLASICACEDMMGTSWGIGGCGIAKLGPVLLPSKHEAA